MLLPRPPQTEINVYAKEIYLIKLHKPERNSLKIFERTITVRCDSNYLDL